MIKYTCTKDLFTIIHGKNQDLKYFRLSHYFERGILLTYLNDLFSIIIEGGGLLNRMNQWFFHINDFGQRTCQNPTQ